MPLFMLSIVGDGGAERLARKLAARAVALSVGTREVTTALSHSIEGVVTPLARDEAPKDTGALAASLRVQATAVPGGYSLDLVSDSPYIDDVVHGTGIYHEPDPHAAWDVDGLQAFEVNGEQVVVMHTHHLGQQPNDFPGRALDRARPQIAIMADAAGAKLATLFWA